jgi:prolyl-tRNA synthetase
MSLASITQTLAALSIKPAESVEHNETDSPASWRVALTANPLSPKSFELVKMLVFKTKAAKNATATSLPVVVIARDETETSSASLAKKLDLKDMRLASEDLLKDLFSLDKHSSTFRRGYSKHCLNSGASPQFLLWH